MCFNDCRLGGCNDGRCSPAATLLDPLPPRQPGTSGVAIALDETHVYFADGDGGRIGVVSKDGSGARDLVTGLLDPWDIAVDGDLVYFAGGDAQVMSVRKDGTALSSIAVDANASNLMVLDGDLYWTSGSTIYWSQGGVAAPAVVARSIRPFALAADTRFVYFIERDSGLDWDGIYAAYRFGMTAAERIVPLSNLLGLALVGSRFYVTTLDLATDLGDLVEVPKNSPGYRPLVLDQRWAEEIAVDETHVYFSVEDYDAIIKKVPRSDGVPLTIASGHWRGEDSYGVVMDMAIDETRVFFALGSGIMSVPK
jgi:hypothetical protein